MGILEIVSQVRAPAVAGRFYPADPTELRAVVATLLADARRDLASLPRAAGHGAQPAIGVIAPHAGYQYSGPTAAMVFARVTVPGLVIILAPNHTGTCRAESGVSLWEAGAFRTPLGEVPVDADAAQTMREMSKGLIEVDHDAHRGEHAIEVELPFLQLLRADVRIVPLVIAWDTWQPARLLGETLAQVIRAATEPILLVASSDLNHYEPAAASEQKDAMALNAILVLDGEELLARCKRAHISMCGRGPAAVLLRAARDLGAKKAVVVDYRHSGWVSGDNGRVVGYAGVVIP